MKLLLTLFILLLPTSVFAQQAKVVQTCGTVPLSLPVGSTQYMTVDVNGNNCIGISSSVPLAPTVSTSAEATHVIKASAGQVQGCYAVNLTSTAGFLLLLNATSAPADGAVTPLAVAPLPANGSAQISGALLNAITFGTGITAVLTSATTPFTKTTGTITGYISCQVI